MIINPPKNNRSHGTGDFSEYDFRKCGINVVFERGVKVFHPENIEIGDNVYIGHDTILKGYYLNNMIIGDHSCQGAGIHDEPLISQLGT